MDSDPTKSPLNVESGLKSGSVKGQYDVSASKTSQKVRRKHQF